jgi:glycosyltransferase involved in cell wall biosynthesis
MNIGFDAKRAYHNGTGLGNYSRTLIRSLDRYHPEHEYFLFNPKASNRYHLEGAHLHQIQPEKFIYQKLSSLWRSRYILQDLKKNNIDLYHGLSHEIPFGIERTGIKSVVTIHDLIFRKYPKQFNRIDVLTYDYKFNYACKHANQIIAISEQTKKDIIELFKISEEKITVCYQSCDEKYSRLFSAEEKLHIRNALKLPERFFLYIGSVIERKGLMKICEAMSLLEKKDRIPLVIIGDGKKYLEKTKAFIREKNMESFFVFLKETDAAKEFQPFTDGSCLPAIYQMSEALIYPSIYEGFGIPVLEALWSETPVITSNISCLPEAGGPDSYYINPINSNEIAEAMKMIPNNSALTAKMRSSGKQHAMLFTNRICAESVMNVYNKP